MNPEEIAHLKAENDWLKSAIIRQEGEETLKEWMDGHTFCMQGMLDERELRRKQIYELAGILKSRDREIERLKAGKHETIQT